MPMRNTLGSRPARRYTSTRCENVSNRRQCTDGLRKTGALVVAKKTRRIGLQAVRAVYLSCHANQIAFPKGLFQTELLLDLEIANWRFTFKWCTHPVVTSVRDWGSRWKAPLA